MDVAYQVDEFVADPDGVLVPESREHRRVRELTAVVAARGLGEGFTFESNLNFYPDDKSNALAPDGMVLEAGQVSVRDKSYRGLAPKVVVEIPSQSDSVNDFGDKVDRYLALGAIVYVLYAERDQPTVERFSPEDREPRRWLGRPCPELGGLTFQVDGDHLVVRSSEGVLAHSAADFVAHFEATAARLAEQLRQAGLQPEL